MEAILHNPTVWVAVSFVLFMLGFIKLALPHITRGLDARSASIRNELDEAVRLREEAQAVLAEYQQRQRDMLVEAESILAHARKEAETLKVSAEAELKVSIERRTKLAHEKIARAEADAVAEVKANVVAVATTAAKSVIQDMMQSHADALIDSATKDLDRLVH